MATEIERKFLVTSDDWKADAKPTHIVQGYLSSDPDRTVRVRIHNDKAFLTIKGRASGISRTEVEFNISIDHARELLPLCLTPPIEKTRHLLVIDSHTWEIDEFHGSNQGLIVAEIELSSENEAFEKPLWVGAEVSHDFRYANSHLSENPYSGWK
ncbi:CYTH domain-containing protein [Rubritalea sp.]|uniref:CYTH domain-containing protein n=1 Tax=Rubritalea sp. TaxID=2109375 RepID=UPI003EF376E0